ncbi:hypothetical protein P389DRAFT_45420 [Cystobasidium minutum MCA 4210]|uniref:uncharacterized protein n=1 Tax=Cystobasidium minutum MCA 4210 TaxID=1397322 RepID=UPI0034CF623E|eukprot:jgi/Rhomi1/45420/CE45419_705
MVKRKIADVESPDAVPTTTSPRKKVVASDFLPVDPAILPDDARLDLADAEIYYIADFIDAKTAKRWYEELVQLDTWHQPTLRMYGRSFLQSRQIVAYGDAKAADSIKYSGTEVPLVKDHPEILKEIQETLEKKLQVRFNHSMLNRYKDGSVHIGSHSDNLENLCIASISLGAVRDFILTHKQPRGKDENKERYRKRFELANGSLVIMQGDTQKYWKHEIPKQLKVKEGRISLTFRQLVDK